MIRVFVVIFASLILAACNSSVSKPRTPDVDFAASGSVDFATVNAKVFQPYCVQCHSDAYGNKGGVNLETYEAIVDSLAQTEHSVFVEKSMPPRWGGGPLPAQEQALLRQWIALGAP